MRLFDWLVGAPLSWNLLPIDKLLGGHVVVANGSTAEFLDQWIEGLSVFPDAPIVPPAQTTWIEGQTGKVFVGMLCETYDDPPSNVDQLGDPEIGSLANLSATRWWVDMTLTRFPRGDIYSFQAQEDTRWRYFHKWIVRFESYRGQRLPEEQYLASCELIHQQWYIAELHRRLGVGDPIVRFLVALDQQGRPIARWISAADMPARRIEHVVPDSEEDTDNDDTDNIGHTDCVGIDAAFGACCWVLGLMNCRNIKMEKRRPSRIERRLHGFWEGAPVVEYHVLDLSATRKRRGRRPSEGGGNRTKPTREHFVRAHFKTYSGERGLFGNLTGTWHWAESRRGDAEAGLVLKSYRLT